MRRAHRVEPPDLSRRRFMRTGLTSLGVAVGAPLLARCNGSGFSDMSIESAVRPGTDVFVQGIASAAIPQTSNFDAIGPLGAPDANGLRLPPGFRSRVIARSRETIAGTTHTWHSAPDGGSTFPLNDGGWIYVSNSEVTFYGGGVSALRFDAAGNVVDAYPILSGTTRNCAGGATPWGTWLSCEEKDRGYVYECDPTGAVRAVRRPALGAFRHEAAAVDLARRQIYLTEDESDGRFYRFTSASPVLDGRLDLDDGTLEVLRIVDGVSGPVEWLPISNPTPRLLQTSTRRQVPESTAFDGGEGVFFHDDTVYFTAKGENRVWMYDVVDETVEALYDDSAPDVLSGVDNVLVSPAGDVLVAEDGGDMQVVVITPSGQIKPIVEVVGQDWSEITGPALDPYRRRLYFSSQRGTSGALSGSGGITYEIEGPFFV